MLKKNFFDNFRGEYLNLIKWFSKGPTINFIPMTLFGLAFILFLVLSISTLFVNLETSTGKTIFVVVLVIIIAIFVLISVPTMLYLTNQRIEYDKVHYDFETTVMTHNPKWKKYHSKRIKQS